MKCNFKTLKCTHNIHKTATKVASEHVRCTSSDGLNWMRGKWERIGVERGGDIRLSPSLSLSFLPLFLLMKGLREKDLGQNIPLIPCFINYSWTLIRFVNQCYYCPSSKVRFRTATCSLHTDIFLYCEVKWVS